MKVQSSYSLFSVHVDGALMSEHVYQVGGAEKNAIVYDVVREPSDNRVIEDGRRVLETRSAGSGPGQPPRRTMAVRVVQDAQRGAPRGAGGLSSKDRVSGSAEGLTISQRLALAGKRVTIRQRCRNSTCTIGKQLSTSFIVFVVLRAIYSSVNMTGIPSFVV